MRLDLRYILLVLISLPKSICFNFRCLPFMLALKLPFFIHYRTHVTLKNARVCIDSTTPVRLFMVKFGNRGSEGIVENKYNNIIINGGSLIFKGNAAFGIGSSIRVEGEMIVGESFSSNRNTFISCTHKISFGKKVLMGWNVSVRDSDGHTLMYDGCKHSTIAPVSIGANVWICAETHILKGTIVGDNSVVGYASLLSKGSDENNVLWAGHPAKIVKQNITWDSSAWDVE